MILESRKRREHLSEEDLQKNKAIMESLTKGNTQGLDVNGEVLLALNTLVLLTFYTQCKVTIKWTFIIYLFICSILVTRNNTLLNVSSRM